MLGFGSQQLVATELHKITSIPNFISRLDMITSTTFFANFYLILVLFSAFCDAYNSKNAFGRAKQVLHYSI